MASSLLFVNSRGEILIYRSYRGDVARSEVLQFCTQIVATKEATEKPVVNLGGVHFIHISHNNITLVAATKTNTNAALMFQFLYKVVAVCRAYFGDFDENHVRKNFVLIYEILDEIMDFGFPQIVDPDLLKLYIT